MNDTTWQRLFGFRHAFDHPVTVVVTLTAFVLLVLAPLLIFITTRAAKSTAENERNSGIVIAPGFGWCFAF
jgi:hypothetical protein